MKSHKTYIPFCLYIFTVVTEKRQELEREIKSEFTATVKRDQDPDTE